MQVVAVEYDTRMVREVLKRVEGSEQGRNLRVIQGDVLKVGGKEWVCAEGRRRGEHGHNVHTHTHHNHLLTHITHVRSLSTNVKVELPFFDVCVANIPYQISSPLLFKLLAHRCVLECTHTWMVKCGGLREC